MSIAPVVTGLNADQVSFISGHSAVLLDKLSNATVSDADSTNFISGNLIAKITAGGKSAEDRLTIVNQGTAAGQIGISGSDVTFGGLKIGTFAGGTAGADLVVTFNAAATPAAAQELVRALAYDDTSASPTLTARTVRVTLTDDTGNVSSANDVTVSVAQNSAPSLTASSGSITFTNGNVVNATSIAVDSGLKVADADNTTLATATVKITGGLQAGEDVLAFTNSSSTTFGNISATYNSATGTLDMASAGATATLAQWQAALDAVTYRDTAATPNTATRTITFSANDGIASSAGVTKTVAFDLSNAAPTQTVPTQQTIPLNTNLVISGGNGNKISIADADAGTSPLKVTLTAGHGTMTLSGKTGLTFSEGDGTADATMTFQGKLADINAALDGMSYAPTATFVGSDAIGVTVNDQGNTGTGGIKSSSSTVPIQVLSANPAVIDVASTSANTTYRSGDSVDVQVSFDRPVTVTTTNGTPSLLLETGTSDHAATYVSGSGSNVLTFRYDVRDFDTTSDLDYVSTSSLSLNGGTIRSAATGASADLTLPTVGGVHSIAGHNQIVFNAIPDIFATANSDGGNTIQVKDADLLTSSFATSKIDTVVYSGAESITLPDRIENLTLTGHSTATVTGNGQTNRFDLTEAGSVRVDGGAGTDSAVFNAKMANFIIAQNENGYQVASNDGTVATLKNVEFLSFDDGLLHTDASTQASSIFSLYNAAFGRYADVGGETFWLSQLKGGMSLVDIAGAFSNSSEFKSLFGAATSDTAYVNALYKNVLDRAPDAQGQSFWVDALSHGTSRAQMLLNFSESAENQADLVSIIGQGVLVGPGFP